VLELARNEIALASDEIIRKVLVHNPDIARLIYNRRTKGDEGIFAYLPLNLRGAMAIVSGALNGEAPDAKMLCRANETPAAIYVWLVFAPGKLAQAMHCIFECVDELAPDGCPIFSRAVTDHAMRLNRRMGFYPAEDTYPGAPDWLIMTEPTKDNRVEHEREGKKVEVRCVRTIAEFMQVSAVRAAVYIAEQLCRYDEEYDGNDFCGTQFLGLVDDDAAGCARVRYFGEFAKLERIAVRPQYRTSDLAFELVRAAIDHCRRKGFRILYGHARYDLVPFYERFGCRTIEDRPAFSFANVEYREMLLDLDPHQDPICLSSDPMKIIRQEGYWDDLGPLECSIATGSDEAVAAVANRMKTLRA